MKIRKFYPLQVYRRMSGAQLNDLDAGYRRALSIALNFSRRMGIVVTVADGKIAVHTASEIGRMVIADLRDIAIKSYTERGLIGPLLEDPPEFPIPFAQSLPIRRSTGLSDASSHLETTDLRS